MTTKKITLLLSLTLLIVFSATILRAQSDEPAAGQEFGQQESSSGHCNWQCRLREQQAQRLEGTWINTVSPVVPPGVPQPPSQVAYLTFARGGAVTSYIRTGPSGPFYGEQHGVWKHLGGNEYALTALRDEFDAQGNFLGTGKINTKLRLTGKDGFVGVGSREFRDPAGNVADIIRCATIKAERIKIEPLAPQCQNITPPR